ncbi:hypothetical protein GGX14DRAFT_401906 [Mycena pura]|uniref:Uncharacterized protein n=1 Tax=Mycena pura TaxID=153505 RepID=A0AAD6UZL9_9AGAR|nr:hypothetical protein GGX14DRAFT_401906 [Mycena pura]
MSLRKFCLPPHVFLSHRVTLHCIFGIVSSIWGHTDKLTGKRGRPVNLNPITAKKLQALSEIPRKESGMKRGYEDKETGPQAGEQRDCGVFTQCAVSFQVEIIHKALRPQRHAGGRCIDGSHQACRDVSNRGKCHIYVVHQCVVRRAAFCCVASRWDVSHWHLTNVSHQNNLDNLQAQALYLKSLSLSISKSGMGPSTITDHNTRSLWPWYDSAGSPMPLYTANGNAAGRQLEPAMWPDLLISWRSAAHQPVPG